MPYTIRCVIVYGTQYVAGYHIQTEIKMRARSNGGHRGKTISGSKPEVYMKYDDQITVRYDKAYLDDMQQRETISTVGDSATLLLGYLLRLASRKKWEEIDDKINAYHFGWSVSKAQRLRLDLEKAGYLRSTKFYANGGGRVTVYYIGKEVVAEQFGDEA